MIIAFDVDGTLINDQDYPRWEVLDLLRAMHAVGCTIYVWSGGGADYATHWVRKLGLVDYVTLSTAKDPTLPVDLAVDDVQDCDLGRTGTLIV